MKRAMRNMLLGILTLLAAAGSFIGTARCEAEWRQADSPRQWRFPPDHGSHPDYRTEWWYFTGNLIDDKGNRYGYQLTFFRHGICPAPSDPDNPWSVRDIYLAHFTITDVKGKRFLAHELVSRTGPGLAGAGTDGLNVWLLNWSARSVEKAVILKAQADKCRISLTLMPRKPIVFHGKKGLSQKGPNRGQASYYVSYTDLATEGTLQSSVNSTAVKVRGVSWFDHEFGSNQLTPEQSGWDWFSLHLSDGRDLMLYFLRRADGSIEKASSGTIVDKNGKSRHLPLSDTRVEVLDRWKSPKTGAIYPSSWRIRIPSEDIDLAVSPLLHDQELVTTGSTGITYWEGAVGGRGTSAGQRVTAEGYVELTGYAGKLGGLF